MDETIPPKPKPSEIFITQAEKIDRNPPEDFGGAFVICPPGGEPITGLLINNSDVNIFWAVVKAKVEAAITELDDKQRAPTGYRRS